MYSKYERRTDTRTYEDRKKLYEGVSKYQLALNSLLSNLNFIRAGKFFIAKFWKKIGRKN